MNYVLDRSDFKKQIVRIIPTAKNTFEHEYNQIDQSDTINNMARAMQSELLKQYKTWTKSLMIKGVDVRR